MSRILIYTDPTPDEYVYLGVTRKVVGSFSTETAECWQSSADDDTTRVWLTPAGKWVLTSRENVYYLTSKQARAWLVRHGWTDAVAEHLNHAERGRPEIGPEVKLRLDPKTIARVEELAAINGFDRSEQMRVLITDAAFLG